MFKIVDKTFAEQHNAKVREWMNSHSVGNVSNLLYKNSYSIRGKEPNRQYIKPEYENLSNRELADLGITYDKNTGHWDDKIKSDNHPSSPTRGQFLHNNKIFALTEKGIEDPNYSLFGLVDNGDNSTILTYKNSYVLPEITVTPHSNYFYNSYDNIKLYNKFSKGGHLYAGGDRIAKSQENIDKVITDVSANPVKLFTPEYNVWRNYLRNNTDYVDQAWNSMTDAEKEYVFSKYPKTLTDAQQSQVVNKSIRDATESAAPYAAAAVSAPAMMEVAPALGRGLVRAGDALADTWLGKKITAGLMSPFFQYGIKPTAEVGFAYDALENLDSPQGYRKTFNELTQGNYWNAVKSAMGDVFDASMVVPAVDAIRPLRNAFINATSKIPKASLLRRTPKPIDTPRNILEETKSVASPIIKEPIVESEIVDTDNAIKDIIKSSTTNGVLNNNVPEVAVWHLNIPNGINPQIRPLAQGAEIEKQLSKQGTISRNQLETYIKKQGNVYQSIMNEVLDTDFAGQAKIDYNAFRDAVRKKIPVYNRIENQTEWDSWGNKALDKLGYDITDPIFNLSTFTFESQGIKGNHKHYHSGEPIGHSRTYTTIDEPDVLHVMESQSDWAQAKKEERTNFTPIQEHMVQTFPERQLQENLRYAAERNLDRMRYPTIPTAAKIEGYHESRYDYKNHINKEMQVEYEKQILPIEIDYHEELEPLNIKKEEQIAPIEAEYHSERKKIYDYFESKFKPLRDKMEAKKNKIDHEYEEQTAIERAKYNEEKTKINNDYEEKLKQLDADLNAEIAPFKAEHDALCHPILDEYKAKRKVIDDECQAKLKQIDIKYKDNKFANYVEELNKISNDDELRQFINNDLTKELANLKNDHDMKIIHLKDAFEKKLEPIITKYEALTEPIINKYSEKYIQLEDVKDEKIRQLYIEFNDQVAPHKNSRDAKLRQIDNDYFEERGLIQDEKENELAPIIAKYEAKLKPIDDYFKPQIESIESKYEAKRKPIRNDYYEKHDKPIYYYEKIRPVLKKYESFPKMYYKLFKQDPKIVTDKYGNTWYEVNVPKNYKNKNAEIIFANGGKFWNFNGF